MENDYFLARLGGILTEMLVAVLIIVTYVFLCRSASGFYMVMQGSKIHYPCKF